VDEPQTPDKRRRIWWLILPLAVLALGAVSLIFLVGNSGLAARYDDPEAILSDYDREGYASLTLHNDGSASLRLEKEDLWYLAEEKDLGRELRETVEADETIRRFGFRLHEGKVQLFVSREILGFLPISFRGALNAVQEGRELVLRTEQVVLGTRIVLPEQRWPELFQREYRLDLSALDGAEEITDFRVEGSTFVVMLSGIRRLDRAALEPDRSLLTAMDWFGVPNGAGEMYDRLRSIRGVAIPLDTLTEAVFSSSDAVGELASWMTWCTPASLSSLWEGQSHFTQTHVWAGVVERAVLQQQSLALYLSGEQAKYERVLFALRETYRSGSLRLDETGFYNSAGEKLDPSAYSRLGLSPTDSRFVFLFSSAGSGEITTEGMPALADVPRLDWRTARLADAKLVPDVGAVLTTRGDIPVLLHRRADGSFALRQLTEETYVSVLVSREIPRLDVDALPAPAEEILRPAGEGWTQAVILPLPAGEEPAG